jgi:hypothetical protein
MSEFQLDTSGVVGGVAFPGGKPLPTTWDDFDSFTQAYVEALFADFRRAVPALANHGVRNGQAVGFSDLAPETLTTILRDCAAIQEQHAANIASVLAYSGQRNADKVAVALDGSKFWEARQRGNLCDFPPLTPTLGDDGLIRFAGGVKLPPAQTTSPNGSQSTGPGPANGIPPRTST